MNRIIYIIFILSLTNCSTKTVRTESELLKIDFNKGVEPNIEVFNARLQGDKENKACYLDGSRDYLKLNIPYLNSDSAFSVSMWIAPFSYTIASAWLSKANANNSKSQWRFGFGWPAWKKLGVTLYAGQWEDMFTEYRLPLYKWSHLVYKLSPENKKIELYVNGVKLCEWTFNEYLPSNNPVYIGLQLDDYFCFHGMIDELIFFKGAISNEKITELFYQFTNSSKVEIDTLDFYKREKYTYKVPIVLNDGIEVGSLDSTRNGFEKVNRAIQKILDKQTDNIKSLLIYKDDKLILEEYFSNHTRDDLNGLASVTKSFTSALLGIAIDKGYIKSVDEKITSFFPSVNSNNSCIEDINISHLINHTSGISGIEIKQPLHKKNGKSNWPLELLKSQDTCRLGEFAYSEINPDLIQCLLNKQTQILPINFAKKYLLQPLMIENFVWLKCHTGLISGGTGLALTSRDMLKFGILYLNNGRFNNKQILSEDWVNSTLYDYKLSDRYNNFWWVGTGRINNITTPYVSASGFGGQHIRIFPELNIVVVITASPRGNGIKPLDLVNNEILPALL